MDVDCMCVLCFAMILMHLEVPELPRMDANVTFALRFAMHFMNLEVPELTNANQNWGKPNLGHVLMYNLWVFCLWPHKIRIKSCRPA